MNECHIIFNNGLFPFLSSKEKENENCSKKRKKKPSIAQNKWSFCHVSFSHESVISHAVKRRRNGL